MAPNADDSETARLNIEDIATTHHGRKIIPDGRSPTTAWIENEEERPDPNSPGENRRLLPSSLPEKYQSKLQAGLTLGVQGSQKAGKCKSPQNAKDQKTGKSAFEKRKDKIITLLKPPYLTIVIIIILVSAHNLLSSKVRGMLEWSPGSWWTEPWRLVTYAFLHASQGHLALNALVAIVVGWPLECEQGWWRVVVVWCGGAGAGALGAGIFQPHVNVVGASAAVFAVLTAHVANVCFRFGYIPLWWFRPLSVFVLCTSELSYALLQQPMCADAVAGGARSRGECTAWAAHLFGCAVGVPLSFLVFTGENSRKPTLIACRIVSAAVLIAGLITATIYFVYYGETDKHG